MMLLMLLVKRLKNMLDNYNRIVEEGTDVSETFDISKVSLTSVFYKNRLSKDKISIYYNPSNIINLYSILQDGYYHIIIIDNDKNINIGDWDDGHSIIVNSYDIFYIKNSIEYKVYRFKNSWFNKEINTDEMCGYEMEKIIPYIRRNKINNILNAK